MLYCKRQMKNTICRKVNFKKHKIWLQQRKKRRKGPPKITYGNCIKENDTDKIKFRKINLYYW